MKRLLLIFALCLFLPRSVSAQSSSVDDFFRRYDASEGFTSVLLEQKMMQMMSRQAAQRGDKGLAGLLKENDYAIGNIDATIIAQKPKMAPHIPTMRENIAEALGIKISQLNIKATTEEGLGFTGKEEGISSQAICSLYRIGKLEEE